MESPSNNLGEGTSNTHVQCDTHAVMMTFLVENPSRRKAHLEDVEEEICMERGLTSNQEVDEEIINCVSDIGSLICHGTKYQKMVKL